MLEVLLWSWLWEWPEDTGKSCRKELNIPLTLFWIRAIQVGLRCEYFSQGHNALKEPWPGSLGMGFNSPSDTLSLSNTDNSLKLRICLAITITWGNNCCKKKTYGVLSFPQASKGCFWYPVVLWTSLSGGACNQIFGGKYWPPASLRTLTSDI